MLTLRYYSLLIFSRLNFNVAHNIVYLFLVLINNGRLIIYINDAVGAAGKAHNKEMRKRKHASITTWREWVEAEGSDTSKYFTMDYSRVRRRRPVHNNSLPVAP